MRTLALLFVTCALLARAGTTTTDYSDLWWNPYASGEGFTITQGNNSLFITFYIYSPTNASPTWYVAAVAGAPPYTGTLYATTCCPPNGSARPVGGVTFNPSNYNAATLTYAIDGATFSKSLVREAIAMASLAGSYIGATIGTYSSSCPAAGYAEEPANVVVTQIGTNVTITATGSTSVCTYSASATPAGRYVELTGTVSCLNGAVGTFHATEVDVSAQALTGRATSTSGSCSWEGRFGGLRRGQ